MTYETSLSYLSLHFCETLLRTWSLNDRVKVPCSIDYYGFAKSRKEKFEKYFKKLPVIRKNPSESTIPKSPVLHETPSGVKVSLVFASS